MAKTTDRQWQRDGGWKEYTTSETAKLHTFDSGRGREGGCHDTAEKSARKRTKWKTTRLSSILSIDKMGNNMNLRKNNHE